MGVLELAFREAGAVQSEELRRRRGAATRFAISSGARFRRFLKKWRRRHRALRRARGPRRLRLESARCGPSIAEKGIGSALQAIRAIRRQDTRFRSAADRFTRESGDRRGFAAKAGSL